MHGNELADRSDDHEEAYSIDARDLELTYSDGTEAVCGLSLAVPRGEFFGFLGANGAGKTTTIKMLSTLLEPTRGQVHVEGYDAAERRRAVRASIGYMAQEVGVDRELTARENLEFACDAYGVARDRRAERIDELLDLVDLTDVASKAAGDFSGGMQKRLDAATALVHDPSLVFLDEPTTGLDPKARTRLWKYFQRINEEGTTIFLTTQYLEEADRLCDHLAVIREGRIVEEGSPDELKRRAGGEILEIAVDGDEETVATAAGVARQSPVLDPGATVSEATDAVRITTERAGERATDLLVALQEAGVDVRSFDVEEPTLDDVFLAIADEEVEIEAARNEAVGNRRAGDEDATPADTPEAPV